MRRLLAKPKSLLVSGIVALLLAVLLVLKDSLIAGLLPKDPLIDHVREATGKSALEVTHVQRHKLADEEGYHFALSDVPAFSASDLAKLANISQGGREILDRAEARGTPVNKATWEILIRGNRNQHIRVLNIVPIDVKHDAPPRGTLFTMGGQSGKEPVELMGIDFDSNIPVVRDLILADTVDGHQFGPPYFDSKTIRIDDQDDVTILLRARATKSPVSFNLRVDYQTGDQTLSTTIQDNGKPFSLTALNCVNGKLDYDAFYSRSYQPTFGAYPKPPEGGLSC